MDDISNRVKAIIGEQLGLAGPAIADDIHFVDDLGIDSLDGIELVIALESHFDLDISDDDCARFASVMDVIAYVRAHTLPANAFRANPLPPQAPRQQGAW